MRFPVKVGVEVSCPINFRACILPIKKIAGEICFEWWKHCKVFRLEAIKNKTDGFWKQKTEGKTDASIYSRGTETTTKAHVHVAGKSENTAVLCQLLVSISDCFNPHLTLPYLW